MKSIRFEQLKTMLKSMSLTLFKRMSIIEAILNPRDKPPNRLYGTDENGEAGWNDKNFYTLPESIYIDSNEALDTGLPEIKAWKDPELTTLISRDEARKILLNNGVLEIRRSYGVAYYKPITIEDDKTPNAIYVYIQQEKMSSASIRHCKLICADA